MSSHKIARASHQSGDLDPEFNGGEILTFENVQAEDVAISSSGRIYMVGPHLPENDYMVSALNPDGRFDPSFNGGKPVYDAFAQSRNSTAEQITVLPDGKILILGRMVSDQGKLVFGLSKYHPDGTLDHSFGTDGHSVPIYEPDDVNLVSHERTARDKTSRYLERSPVSLHVHGRRIYAAGLAEKRVDNKLVTMLMCLDETGNLIQDFGSKGFTLVEHPEYHLDTRCILATENHIYLAGNIQTSLRNYRAWSRLHLDGRLDVDFGSNGFVYDITDEYLGSGSFTAVVLQNDLNLVGSSWIFDVSGMTQHAMLDSIDRDGGKNLSFNNGEPVLTPIGWRAIWTDCAIQPSGRIVTSGWVYVEESSEFADLIAGRFLPNGSLDTSFGNGTGWTQIKVGNLSGYYPVASAVQRDNGIVVTGSMEVDRRITAFVLRLRG